MATADWNFVVHLAADALLSQQSANILASITAAAQKGASTSVNVFIEQVTEQGTLTSIIGGHTTVTNLGKVNTGDPASLTKLLVDTAHAHPATKTALIIYGHGNGVADWAKIVVKKALRNPAAITGTNTDRIGLTFSYADALTIPELRTGIVDSGIHLDLIGMNACVMGMVEVAYQLRDLAEVMVASEVDDSDKGWPYSAILDKLFAKPTMLADELASVILHEYGAHADKVSFPGLLSGTRLGKMADLAAMFTVIVEKMTANAAGAKAARASLSELSSFPFVDLLELINQLRDAGIDVGNAAAQLAAASVGPLQKWGVTGHGLGLYFPTASSEAPHLATYRAIAFTTITGWADYLTHRLARP